MAGAPPGGRRARTTRATPSNYVRTTLLFGAHSSSRIRGPSCWSQGTYHTDDTFQVRADDTALRNTLLVSAFGRIISPPAVSYRPLRRGTAQAPPIRLVCSAITQHVAQHISASCQHKRQDRPSTCTFFRASGLRHMHDAPRTSILESTLRRIIDGDFA